jgi:hypothetical protein
MHRKPTFRSLFISPLIIAWLVKDANANWKAMRERFD